MPSIITADQSELYVKDWGVGQPVIEQTGAKDAVIVGFSMGGGEVARYMSRHNGKSVATKRCWSRPACPTA